MVDEITIKVRAETDEATQNVQEFRTELGKTQQATDRMNKSVASSSKGFSSIGKSLGNLSPTMGKLSQMANSLSQSWAKVGNALRNNRFTRPRANENNNESGSRVGGLGRFAKIAGIAGIATLGAGLLGSIFGGSGGKLASIDKLNAVGTPSIFDFLEPYLKPIKEFLEKIKDAILSLVTLVTSILAFLNPFKGGGEQNEGSMVDEDQSIASINEITDYAKGQQDSIATHWDNILSDWRKTNEHDWALVKALGIDTFNTMQSKAQELGESMEEYLVDVWGAVEAAGLESFDTLKAELNKLKSEVQGQKPSSDSSENPFSLVQEQAHNDVLSDIWNSGVIPFSSTVNKLNEGGNWDIGDYADLAIDALTVIPGVGLITKGAKIAKTGGILDTIGGAVKGAADAVGNALNGVWNGLKGVFGFAEGGVFQPNSPQLVWMGDNKTQPEVAAPYNLIVQAVQDALRTIGQNGAYEAGPKTIEVVTNLNGKVVARTIYDDLENERRRRNGSAMV